MIAIYQYFLVYYTALSRVYLRLHALKLIKSFSLREVRDLEKNLSLKQSYSYLHRRDLSYLGLEYT